jgi:hypothetical protein
MSYFELFSLLNIYVHIYFYRITKPGGYIEVAGRHSNNVDEGPVFRKISEACKHIYYFNFNIL